MNIIDIRLTRKRFVTPIFTMVSVVVFYICSPRLIEGQQECKTKKSKLHFCISLQFVEAYVAFAFFFVLVVVYTLSFASEVFVLLSTISRFLSAYNTYTYVYTKLIGLIRST